MNDLPSEVWSQVFSWLPTEDRKNVRLTCSAFYDACNIIPIIQTEKFTIYGNYTALEFEAVLGKSRYKRFHLHFNEMYLDEISTNFWRCCGPKMSSLSVERSGYSCNALKDIVTYCTNLRHWKLNVMVTCMQEIACICNVPNICIVTMAMDQLIKEGVIRNDLISLDISVLPFSNYSETLIGKLLTVFPKIRSFTLTDARFEFIPDREQLRSHGSWDMVIDLKIDEYANMAAMKELVIDIPTINDNWFKNITTLKSLRLEKVRLAFDRPMEIINWIFAFFSNQKQLKSAELILRNINNEDSVKKLIKHVIKECPNLWEFGLEAPYIVGCNLYFSVDEFREILSSNIKIFDFSFKIKDKNREILADYLINGSLVICSHCDEDIAVAIIKRLRYLNTLEVQCPTDRILQTIFRYHIQLTRLCLYDIDKCTSYGFTGRKITECGSRHENTYQYSIKQLQVLKCLRITTDTWTFGGEIFSEFEFPGLNHLDIQFYEATAPFSFSELLYIFKKAPLIEVAQLSITSTCVKFSLDEVSKTFSAIPKKVRHLDLMYASDPNSPPHVTEYYRIKRIDGYWMNSTDLFYRLSSKYNTVRSIFKPGSSFSR